MQYPDPDLWQEFFAVLATAAAALVGLFFVVSSLHLDKFAKDRVLQRRAQNIAIVMMLLFLQALTVLVPQDRWALGAEIFLLNIIILYFPFSAAWIMHKNKLKSPVIRIATTILCAVGAGLGGLLLVMNWRWSIHVVAAADAISMFVLVVNAWSLMLGAWRTELLKQI